MLIHAEGARVEFARSRTEPASPGDRKSGITDVALFVRVVARLVTCELTRVWFDRGEWRSFVDRLGEPLPAGHSIRLASRVFGAVPVCPRLTLVVGPEDGEGRVAVSARVEATHAHDGVFAEGELSADFTVEPGVLRSAALGLAALR